jgi:hypothetical protein
MNDDYFREQASRIRAMADKADPFTKKRLLDLALTYDARLCRIPRSPAKLPSVAINSQHHGDHHDGGRDSG